MAAKALSSLVPLQKVPTELVTIIDQIISSLKVTEDKINHDNQVKRFSSNLLHGMLLQIYDLITNLKWFVCGESADMGNNKVFLIFNFLFLYLLFFIFFIILVFLYNIIIDILFKSCSRTFKYSCP